jgi:hypothetical protein
MSIIFIAFIYLISFVGAQDSGKTDTVENGNNYNLIKSKCEYSWELQLSIPTHPKCNVKADIFFLNLLNWIENFPLLTYSTEHRAWFWASCLDFQIDPDNRKKCNAHTYKSDYLLKPSKYFFQLDSKLSNFFLKFWINSEQNMREFQFQTIFQNFMNFFNDLKNSLKK